MAAPANTPAWNLAQRVGFRFAAVYLLLYGFGENGIARFLPGLSQLARAYIRLWHTWTPWVAIHVFGLSGPATTYLQNNGSGDTTLEYVQCFCWVAVSIAAALVWSILDRRRSDYRQAHAWLRIFVRYTLAFTLFEYGFAKVFPMQFRPPGLTRLLEPLHQFSPMGLLWTFMGFSPAYTIFAGAMEVTGGALLLFRPTTTLGALVSAAVLANVVALNFCYDVPVKLFSTNLLLMALFLAAPDLGRLARVFVLNRPAMPSKTDAVLFTARPVRIATVVVKTVFIALIFFVQIRGSLLAYRSFNAAQPPLYGVWQVETFTRNGQPVPPLATDSTCWRRVLIERPDRMLIEMADDSRNLLLTRYDPGQRAVHFTADGGPQIYDFHYTPPGDRVTLTGKLTADDLVVGLRRIDPGFRLIHRGFHWINERPFNR